MFVHTAGNGAGAVNTLARNHANHFLAVFAQFHALHADFRIVSEHGDNMAFVDVAFKAEQQIRAGQMKKMQGV